MAPQGVSNIQPETLIGRVIDGARQDGQIEDQPVLELLRETPQDRQQADHHAQDEQGQGVRRQEALAVVGGIHRVGRS